MSPRNHSVPLMESQHHVINPTNPGGALDDGVKDRLHIRGRAADDAEHLGRCGLMLRASRSSALRSSSLLEQPHVFDGDDGLVSESFKQGNLLICKRANLCASNHDGSDRNAFTQQRRSKYSPSTPALSDSRALEAVLDSISAISRERE